MNVVGGFQVFDILFNLCFWGFSLFVCFKGKKSVVCFGGLMKSNVNSNDVYNFT